jgi:Xaa-Pro aminopeptidase
MLEVIHSKQRQKRLLNAMSERTLDAVAVSLPHHIYYFSAHSPHELQFGAFVLFADGRSWLISGNKPAEKSAADEAVSYEAQWLATLRSDQPAVVAWQVLDKLKSRRVKRVGIDASAVGSQIAVMFDKEIEPIDPALWQIRRCKFPDELALMRRAYGAAGAMYRRAREIIAPGMTEMEVFIELQATATRNLGEPLSAPLGNDYTCGGGGGPPRADRACKAGELYILDLGPSYRRYFADACRTICVDRNPTDAQMAAWRAIDEALEMVEKSAKPGTRCRELFEDVSHHLKSVPGCRFPHHLGHGVGLQPHEFPHLNPKWDDVLMEGEVFAAEPGLYAPELAGGIRLENGYVVTANGVESLIDHPLEL